MLLTTDILSINDEKYVQSSILRLQITRRIAIISLMPINRQVFLIIAH